MTNRERILAILGHRSPDRIPFVPRLLLWYNARQAMGDMPDQYRGLSLRQLEQAIGVGTPGRDGRVYVADFENVEVRQRQKGDERLTEYITPAGSVSQLDVKGEGSVDYATDWLPRELPIKGLADYAVMEYIYEHTRYRAAYDRYLAYEQEIGDDGYPMVSVGDAPFHHFLLRLAGYGQAYFELADHLPQVEHLIKVMEQVEIDRLWPVVLGSPARLLLHGLHFDSQMTPPRLFERYITPYYQKITSALHAAGKTLAYHADDDAQAILRQVRDAGFDMAECFTTAPMVSVTLQEARAVWGNDVIIFGGIPSIILEEAVFGEEEFREYMRSVLRTIAPGDAFILGVADNVMPGASIERVEWIAHLLEEYGSYPIKQEES